MGFSTKEGIAMVFVVGILMLGAYVVFTGGTSQLATAGGETAVTTTPSGETVLTTKEACGDGKPDILDTISFKDYGYSPARSTQVATAYRIYLGGSPNAYTSGTSSATAATSTTDVSYCGDTANVIAGSSTPNGGYYFAESGVKTMNDAKTIMDVTVKPTGDVSTLTFDAPNATGAALATITLDASGGTSNGQIKAILTLNSTSGTYGYHDDSHAAILLVSEFEKGNFSDVKPAAVSGWTITSDTVPTNYTNINSGYQTQAWRIDGIKLNPTNTEVKVPLYIKASDGINPGAVANSTAVSVTFYDLSTDLVDGKLVYGWVNQTDKRYDIGAPNRASVAGAGATGTTGIHVV